MGFTRSNESRLISRLRVQVHEPEEGEKCRYELESGIIYSLKGIHWFRHTLSGDLIKVRYDCMPDSIIKVYEELER